MPTKLNQFVMPNNSNDDQRRKREEWHTTLIRTITH